MGTQTQKRVEREGRKEFGGDDLNGQHTHKSEREIGRESERLEATQLPCRHSNATHPCNHRPAEEQVPPHSWTAHMHMYINNYSTFVPDKRHHLLDDAQQDRHGCTHCTACTWMLEGVCICSPTVSCHEPCIAQQPLCTHTIHTKVCPQQVMCIPFMQLAAAASTKTWSCIRVILPHMHTHTLSVSQ